MRPRTLAEETELARAAGDYYIPPYKLAQMTKTAAKILDILNAGTFQPSHEECRIVMDMVEHALECGQKKCPQDAGTSAGGGKN
jgi:hypothetical protein